MAKATMIEAIRAAIDHEMARDENVYCIGEDIAVMGGSFGITKGLLDKYGKSRVIDTPISEQMIIGSSVSAAITGMRPIAELMFADFLLISFDQIANQAAKARYFNGGKISVPMVVRLPGGCPKGAAGHHSQNLEALVAHIPGLKVVYPSTPQEAYGLMLASVRDDNPVMFFEHKRLYREKGEFEDNGIAIPIGVADVKKEGKDVTVIATGRMVHVALSAAEQLSEEGIDIEVVDPRSLFPLDKETIFKSVSKTGKVVIITEENKRGAWSGELASVLVEEKFDLLKKPIIRIGSLNTPVPFTANLEDYILPHEEDVIKAVKSII